jgi:hypothetical protein
MAINTEAGRLDAIVLLGVVYVNYKGHERRVYCRACGKDGVQYHFVFRNKRFVVNGLSVMRSLGW